MTKRYLATAVSLAAASLSGCNVSPKELPQATKDAIAISGKVAASDLSSDAVAGLLDQKNSKTPIYVGVTLDYATNMAQSFSYQTDKVTTCLALGESLRANNSNVDIARSIITCNGANGRPLVRFVCNASDTCKPG